MRARKRRAYLEYFHKNAAGEYVYAGDLYEFQGDARIRRRALIRLWTCLGAAAALTVLGACIPVPGLTGTWYILIPYVASVIALFAALWSLGEITAGGEPLREYIYEKARKRLRFRMILAAACAVLALVGELVFSLPRGITASGGLFLGWEAVSAGTAGLGTFQLSRLHWSKRKEE